MEYLNVIVSNYKLIIKLIPIIFMIKKLKECKQDHAKAFDQIKRIQRSDIISLKEAVQLSKNEQQKLYLIKLIPQNSLTQNKSVLFTIQKNLYSNQYWCIQPSVQKISHQIMGLINKASEDQKKNKKLTQNNKKVLQQLIWNAPLNSTTSLKVKGFGRIINDNIFTIETYHKIDQKRGILTKIYQNISYFFEQYFFGDVINKIRSVQKRKLQPTLKGPIIGELKFILKFLANQSILLHAKIQNGWIIPILTASSRHQMIDFLENQLMSNNFKIALILMGITINSYFIKKDVKLIWKNIKSKFRFQMITRQIKDAKVFKRNSMILSQDKLCIICYENGRNTLFFQCKHLILCDQCYENLPEAKCPLCKEDIHSSTYLYQKTQGD